MFSFCTASPPYPPIKEPYVTAEVHGGETRFRCNFRKPNSDARAVYEVRWFRSSDNALLKNYSDSSEFLLKSEIKYFGNDVRSSD